MECHGSGEICRWYRSIFGNVVEMWMAMGWSDGRSGLQCLLACTLLKVIRFLRVGMSEAIKSWSIMTFCLVGEEGSQILCVPTLQLSGRDLYAGTELCVERLIQLDRSTDHRYVLVTSRRIPGVLTTQVLSRAFVTMRGYDSSSLIHRLLRMDGKFIPALSDIQMHARIDSYESESKVVARFV
jgi:hypothetical protein